MPEARRSIDIHHVRALVDLQSWPSGLRILRAVVARPVVFPLLEVAERTEPIGELGIDDGFFGVKKLVLRGAHGAQHELQVSG